MERFAYRQASAVICNAAHEVAYLERLLGTATVPVHVVRNGLDMAPPERTREGWRRQLDIPEKALVAVMLANFRPQKDHASLLHAWARVILSQSQNSPLPVLVLAGAPQFTHKEAKHLAEELGILGSVRFPGQVQDVAGMLRACDLGILTSHHEGLSNAVLEYMACGLPVIATDLPANRELLGDDAGNRLVPVGDPEGIAGQLAAACGDVRLMTGVGMANRLRAEKEFSVEQMCRSTEEIMVRLIGASIGRGW